MHATSATEPPTPTEFRALARLMRMSGGSFESTVAGTSMAPVIPHGARIRIKPLEPDAYQVGQVVACATGNSMFAHRIVYCSCRAHGRDFVVTKGDGWMLCDSPTRRSDIMGLVTHYLHDGSWYSTAPQASETPLNRAVGRASLMLIRPALTVHPGLARRVAGTCLVFGSLGKRLSALWPWPGLRHRG